MTLITCRLSILTSKRTLASRQLPKIDSNHSHLQSFGDPPAARDVLGDDETAQTNITVISNLDDFFLSLEAVQRYHWREDLLTCCQVFLRHIEEYRWLQEVSVETVRLVRFAPEQERCSVRFRI